MRLCIADRRVCRSPAPSWLALVFLACAGASDGSDRPTGATPARTAHAAICRCSRTPTNCVACHNNLDRASGEDVSIGATWRATMMANSARDPYWQAGVRRETIDHPQHAAGDPGRMRGLPHADGAAASSAPTAAAGEVFAHLPIASAILRRCVGWQRTASRARCVTRSRRSGSGRRESFNANFVDEADAAGRHAAIFGPYDDRSGRGRSCVRSPASCRPRRRT